MKFFLNFQPMSFHGEILENHFVAFDFAQSAKSDELTCSVSSDGSISYSIENEWVQVSQQDKELLNEVVIQLSQYFEGKRRAFDLPLQFKKGTEFQKMVWSHLKSIPYGQTKSYSGFAQELNKPLAVRAVGGAIGKNPFGLLIPCHRVIGKDGSLTGFAGGVPTKKVLLDLEKRFN